MPSRKIRIIWFDEAKADLKYIYKRILKKTKSIINAKNVQKDIIEASKQPRGKPRGIVY
jgi:hypothetical protein